MHVEKQLLFALNLVTLLMQIQLCIAHSRQLQVVICFKFSNFAYANTVGAIKYALQKVLLFALNLVTLLMQIQFLMSAPKERRSCYLL